MRRPPRLGHGDARGRSAMLLVMLLRNVLSMDRKPPLTLSLVGMMCGLHFQKMISPARFRQFSLCPDRVFRKMELSRVVMSALLHVDDVHLYHNMISFIWKGYHLEHRLRPVSFALVIVYLLLLCHMLVVLVGYGAGVSGILPGQERQCSIGFSGVLFGLKVLLNYDSPTFTTVYGIQVPTKYAAWLELVVIHMLVPRASFLGHMCGILAGYCFVLSNSEKRVIDPMASLLSRLWGLFSGSGPSAFGPRATAHSETEAFEDDETIARRLQDGEYRRATTGVRQRYETYEASQTPAQPSRRDASITQEELRRRRVVRLQQS